MNLFSRCFPMGLALCLAACAAPPLRPAAVDPLLAELSTLPVSDAQRPQATPEDLRFHAGDPARVPTEPLQGDVDPFALENALLKVRAPVRGSDAPVTSLSHRVKASPLAECDQTCSFPMKAEGDIPTHLVQFTCADQGFARLREYPDPEDGAGFALPRDRVNLLVQGHPAWLLRLRAEPGQHGSGATLLAWRGSQQGYSLLLSGSDDAAARRAVAIAETLP